MIGYLLRRLLHGLVVLWAAFTISFVILFLLPSDPAQIILSGGLGGGLGTPDPAELERLRAEMGLDRPLPVQYLTTLARVLTGDLGTSYQTGQPVAQVLLDALPSTVQLAGLALVLAVVFGLGSALLASAMHWIWLERLLTSLPGVAASVPPFWTGLMLLQLLSYQWRIFPAVGDHGIASLILPAVTVAIPVSTGMTQVFSRSLRTQLTQPYVTTAVAKGAPRSAVVLRHAARNAALPVLTMLGLTVGQLIAGSVLAETVFGRNGIGRVTVGAVSTQDIPVVQGVVLLSAIAFVLASLLVDILNPVIDRRLATVSTVRTP